MKLRQRAGDSERELRARSETGVPRQRPVHTEARTGSDAESSQEPGSERGGPIRIGPVHFERVGPLRREQERRRRRRRADAAKPASQRSPQVEDPEVKPRRRLDKHDIIVHASFPRFPL